MLPPEDAWRAICQASFTSQPSQVDLNSATGAYLAEAILADRDIPPADRAAMDGFAVRAADLAEVPVRLRVLGEIAAGQPATRPIGSGECICIFTGANLPPGADAVVAVEDTHVGRFAGAGQLEEVEIRVRVEVGRNVFRRGENARRGQELLAAGTQLGPRQLAVAAACGHARVKVHPRPRVAILTTGAELLPAGAPAPGAHEIRDSNEPMVAAACALEGFAVVLRRRVADDLEATQAAIQEAGRQADVVILTGGVSAGRYDLVRPALEGVQAHIRYHGVAMKPGRPQLFAVLPDGAWVFGLPGNPLSALVGLHEFVLPGLRRLAGCPAERCRPALHLPLAKPLEGNLTLQRMVLARLMDGEAGTRVAPLEAIGSADFVTGSAAEGTILLPPGIRLWEAGAAVAFRPWRAGI
jgi:molybdenum cofactor synthesis domain-containing protein